VCLLQLFSLVPPVIILWHLRLGKVNVRDLDILSKQGLLGKYKGEGFLFC